MAPRDLGRGKAGLWALAGLDVTLVCSPASADAEVWRERYCWKQRLKRAWHEAHRLFECRRLRGKLHKVADLI